MRKRRYMDHRYANIKQLNYIDDKYITESE